MAEGRDPDTPPHDALNTKILADELSTVSDWYQLGIKLGVPDYKLDEIQRSYPTEGCCRWRVEALSLWLRCTPNSSWKSVVRALQKMEENTLAERIQRKYIKRQSTPTSGHPTAPHVISPTLQAGSQNPVVPAAHQILRTHSVHPIEEDSGAVAIARENWQKIKWKFGVLLKNSCKKLREKHLNVKDFRLFLKGLFPPDCVPESSNVDDIFEAITHNKLWNHWNCSPLQKVVQEFLGDDQEMKSWIETYKKDLTSYKATTRLVDYITVVDSDPSSDNLTSDEEQEQAPAKYDRRFYRKLSIKLEAKFTSHTLEYLDDLWKEFADLYNLPPLVTLLDCVCKSSIVIIWLIPAHLAHHILRAAPGSVDIFRKHQITRVEFDGVCIYPEAKQHSEAMELGLGDLATVRKELHEARTKWYDIGLELKVPVGTLDSIEVQSDDPKKCLLEALKHWLKTVDPKPTWQALVDALRSCVVEENQLANFLEEKHCPKSKSSPLLERARAILKPVQNATSGIKDEFVQDIVQEFVITSLQSDKSLAKVQAQLQKLHKEEFLIKEGTFKKAQELAIEIHAQLSPAECGAAVASMPVSRVSQPLFSKDTVYHAGICSFAVSTCDAGNYQSFFKKKDLVPGHSFHAVSISRSKQDRYLIARQGDSTYYFALQSEPHLMEWSKKFTSFNEGITSQSERFPLRFIVELLNKQCRIVLTGFSFGGLLACTVAACVWDLPYISSDLLKENLACITFGQPHVTLQIVQQVAMRRPDLATTIHTVYSQDDCVPQLMRFLDESWSSEALLQGAESSGIQWKVPEHLKAPFKDATTSLLLQQLGKLQAISTEGKESDAEGLKLLPELKSHLKGVASKLVADFETRQLPLCSTSISYLISSAGLVWNKMTKEQAHTSSQLGIAEVEALAVEFFEQHSMAAYSKKVFNGFLDRDPKYTIPSAPKHALGEIGDLKPEVDSVELRRLGSETAIVLEGSNLWFCYQVIIGTHTVKLPAKDLSSSSFQFNVQKENHKIATEGGKVKVALHSHFSKPVKQEVPANEKLEWNVSSRQQQLARLTPSKLIELAYLSALLEQYPHNKSQPLSHKVEVIKTFLKDVVRVVPLESIFFAIGYGNPDVVLPCSQVLIASNLDLPPSFLMTDGFQSAVGRAVHGLPPKLIQMTHKEAKKPFPHPTVCVSTKEKSGGMTYTISPHIPGIIYHDLFSPPLARFTVSPEELDLTVVDSPEIKEVGMHLKDMYPSLVTQAEQGSGLTKVVSSLNIELLYPISGKPSQHSDVTLKSPLDILITGRKELASLATTAQLQLQADATFSEQRKRSSCLLNQQMLEILNKIRKKDLATCTALLGGFMEQQEVDIPLVKSRLDQSNVLELSAAATVGVWALFSLNYSDIQPILSKCHEDQLLVKILDYVKTVLGPQSVVPDDAPYAAKLQFIVQGMTKTVICNTQYISYSLERQLVNLCKECKIDDSTSLCSLTTRWDRLFKETTLSLVALSHRPLIARWLKWALMVHNLREELAKYTAVGVAGLVNSGKSVLVNTVFGIKIPTGTTEMKRTTVPFLYNLDKRVEGLDVVDFPGVDDEDDTIGDLADLLLTIAQIIIFVVDYRKAHTQSAKKWLERLQVENVPVLVCLTFGDKLYAEHMRQGKHLKEEDRHPPVEYMRHQLKEQLSAIQGKLQSVRSHKIQFFSFSQDNDSVLNSEEGRRRLKDVGIDTPVEVGEWLVEVFRKDFGKEQLADQLDSFIHIP